MAEHPIKQQQLAQQHEMLEWMKEHMTQQRDHMHMLDAVV
jgi:hypothetical protein